jgi:hypothetical protein
MVREAGDLSSAISTGFTPMGSSIGYVLAAVSV